MCGRGGPPAGSSMPAVGIGEFDDSSACALPEPKCCPSSTGEVEYSFATPLSSPQPLGLPVPPSPRDEHLPEDFHDLRAWHV